MRFAIKTAPQNTTWADMLDVWRAADDIELFESAWNFDHFEPIYSDRRGPCMEGWSMLAGMATATRRLRLGCLVTGNVYRHPAVLANIAATVDIMSGGRLELGIGAGWNQDECGAYGIDLPPLRERFDRFDEALEVIVRLLRDEVSNFDGRYYRLTEACCEPKPVQRPHPPICIGGRGEKRTLRAAARHAQHWNFPGGAITDFHRLRDVLHAHCADIGRDPTEIRTSTHVRIEAGQEPKQFAETCAEWDDAGLDLAIIYLPPPHRAAVLEPLADALRHLAN